MSTLPPPSPTTTNTTTTTTNTHYYLTNIGLGYAIAIAFGFLVLLSTLLLASYICLRHRHRRRQQQQQPQLQNPTNDTTGVIILPNIFFVDENNNDNDEDQNAVVGLDQSVINSYPKFPFSKEIGNGMDSICSICLCDYKESEMMRMLPDCKHCFHLICVDAWLKMNATCPVCRSSPLPTPLSTPLAEVVPLSLYTDGHRRRGLEGLGKGCKGLQRALGEKLMWHVKVRGLAADSLIGLELGYLFYKSKCIFESFERSRIWKMKFRIWSGIPRFVFVSGVLSLLCIALFSKFYAFTPFLVLDKRCNYGVNSRVSFRSQIEILETVIKKIEQEIVEIRDSNNDSPYASRYGSFLADILGPVESVKSTLAETTVGASSEGFTDTGSGPGSTCPRSKDHVLPEFFLTEEIRKYVRAKPNRLGKQNFMGANGTFTSIGHACFSMKLELEEYMNYDVGEICNDDWRLAQRLMVHGCDPLPRRRCLSLAPKFYTKPLPISDSVWRLPDDKNVRWSQYRCKNFACLAANKTGKGFFKCSDCFNLTHHEFPRWVVPIFPDPTLNSTPDFRITDVLGLKPNEIRIGLDFSVGTGTFAARMREHNVTIVSAAINLGAPFNEMIALRGLVPLYLTINQRLPFFDNTLDLIHTSRFLDGWIDYVLLEFVLYDWDRVLRPGGLLWVDSFFCLKDDLEGYLESFGMLRYKKHQWVVVPKMDKDDDREVFFSAVLEKPPRPF
ncbi:hypothetical protein OSB04_031936 [Centaurea solstitialis]|uniref:RING-type domain-containing protein n=1 Tax=Centaurea solstitialis TaxID=347529 RepID=A0AA38SBD1_9ASTR|nr:hypothetical protein OSB04_031936 [Centaurea solstitialis]